jgi:ketosteroid isomerase-like protein
MSQENVETVRRALIAVLNRSWPKVLAELNPEIEIEDTVIPDGSDYRGHKGFFRWLERWNESWEGWRLENIEIVSAGDDYVVGLWRMVAKGKGSGIEIDRPDAVVYKLRDSKIVRMAYYNDQDKALKAAGLSVRPPAESRQSLNLQPGPDSSAG